MRKILCVLLMLTLCLSLFAGCQQSDSSQKSEKEKTSTTTEKTEPSTEQTEKTQQTSQTEPLVEAESEMMEQLQQELVDNHALCAVAFLGVCEGDFETVMDYFSQNGLTEALPLLEDLTSDVFLESEGAELYMVVPRRDVGLTVYEQVLDEETYELTWDKSLYVGHETEPLLLRCNVSDIVPNLCLFIEGQGGESMEYSPCLSLEDGSLNDHSMIYDLTPYELILGGYDGPEVGEIDSRIGTWYTESMNTAGETLILELILNYDGSATYGYGYPQQEFLEYFEGVWYEREGNLVLELFGGLMSVSDESEEEKYSICSEFEWNYQSRHLFLSHVSGESFIFGLEGGTFDFVPSNFYAVAGLWSTSEYSDQIDGYIYYELELLANGECNLLKHDGEGSIFGAYEGWWSFEDGNITLSLRMHSGREYSDTDEQLIDGVYAAAIGSEAWLTLEHISGDVITEYMNTSGEDYFEPTVAYG